MADETKKVVKGRGTPKAKVDISILSEADKETLRAKAKKTVSDEATVAAKAAYLEQLLNEERQAVGLDEPIVEFFIDLAPYADRITLDGVIYFQKHTVKVRESVAAVMAEMVQATWRHQSIIDGKNEDFYRKKLAPNINPNGSVSNLLRA